MVTSRHPTSQRPVPPESSHKHLTACQLLGGLAAKQDAKAAEQLTVSLPVGGSNTARALRCKRHSTPLLSTCKVIRKLLKAARHDTAKGDEAEGGLLGVGGSQVDELDALQSFG